jgi:uncharacterized protein (DUF697 family)
LAYEPIKAKRPSSVYPPKTSNLANSYFGSSRAYEIAEPDSRNRYQHAKEIAMGHFGNPLTEYSPEMEAFEFEQGFRAGPDSVFHEAEEMELAAELLEVSNEQELEQFLGDFIKKAGKAIGGIIKSPIGQAIGGVLKSAAKVALPIAGGALGTFVGGPIGTSIGSSLGSMAGKALGLELEGLSQEDREFEAARQFVRFAGETVKNALEAPPNANPFASAKAAAVEAAREHAPGLLDDSFKQSGHHHHHHHHLNHHGRWVRHGDKIALYGL